MKIKGYLLHRQAYADQCKRNNEKQNRKLNIQTVFSPWVENHPKDAFMSCAQDMEPLNA